jgi:hypothetical protein
VLRGHFRTNHQGRMHAESRLSSHFKKNCYAGYTQYSPKKKKKKKKKKKRKKKEKKTPPISKYRRKVLPLEIVRQSGRLVLNTQL